MMFKGTGVALVTPFKKDQSVDFDALRKLVDFTIDGGVDFLVALGTTAETPTLTKAEKLEVLDCILKHNNKRKPVVLGLGSNNTQELLESLSQYPMQDVDGILSVVPYYNKPSQEGLFQHFSALAEATDKPIILYNVPGRTVANMLPATTLRLANKYKHIVAIKEASGNMAQCMELVQGAPDHFAVLSGDDNLIVPQLSIGFHGVISVAANSFPVDFCAMVNAGIQEDFVTARKLHYKLLKGIDLLFAEGNPTGVKYVLHKSGLMENVLRLPLIAASESLSQQLDQYLNA
ncbi:4-hydroxy-tetrahydrodipicolinate synthase [Edaphocola aurantiacus]|uniref:4-hydroxy-tetrahydrodipicolinate synthase n=1 Tax=Edaphocola aurantiacus TaxID=2601682 RepID=UPI001C940D6B|nr:4-hydroxy-tetrahydrodipicolinate synthase [Edaphocola aurantiacus]